MKINDTCEHGVSKAELCRLCGAAASPAAPVEHAQQCSATCADFPMYECAEPHRCVLNVGHPFDPLYSNGIHEFHTHQTIVKPRIAAPTPSLPTRDAAREIARRCVRSFDESFSYQASHADVLAIIERHAQAIISRYFAAETVGERGESKEVKNA